MKTELDSHHLDVLHAALGDNVPPGQEVGEYVQGMIRGIENVDDDGKSPQIVAEGLALKMATTWIDAFAPFAKALGVQL